MNEPDAAARIEEWIRANFSVSPSDPRFARDVNLFDAGYVDSVGLIELLAFLEDQFGVEVPDEVLVSDEFTTINGMAGWITR